MFLSKNLRHLRRKNNRQTQEELANALGLTRSVISSYEDGRAEPSVSTLIRMSEYFNTTIESLTNLDLANVDEKQVMQQRELQKYASGVSLKVSHVHVERVRNEAVRLVPERAAAGYTAGYGDEQVLELPGYELPYLGKGKEYRAFEIVGDSMLPLKPKSIVIAERVEELSDVKDGQVYVVVSKKDGIVLKKVYSRIAERGTLLLKSSNLAYQPYEVDAEDVKEIWRFNSYISRDLPEQIEDIQEIKRAFVRMESELQELRQAQVSKS